MRVNKKGDLLNNVLSVIIALIGLLLIVFVAVKLWGITVNQDEENVKNTLNVIEGKIKNLNDGETGKYPIQSIGGWFLSGWSGDDKERPDKCFLKSCICICKGNVENYFFNSLEISKKCQEEGFCRDVSKEKVEVRGDILVKEMIESHPIEGEPAAYITKRKIVNYIAFPKNLIEIEIKKEKDLLSIVNDIDNSSRMS